MANPNHPAGPAPREAIDYLQAKGVRAGFSYLDVWREEHSAAFTVAKVMELDVLSDIRKSLTAAQQTGQPFEAWKKQIAAHLAAKGWGAKRVKDPKTGKAVVVDLTHSRRLETIWRVNMGQAAQAGVWERGTRSTSHPYVLYRVGPSKQHRDQHLAWNGVLLPQDDPFWAVANPRNGWGCKCYTRFVSRAQYARYQKSGLPGVKQVQTKAPLLRPMQYVNRRTQETHTGYQGIDPGFERNPGVGRLQQLGQQFRQRDRRFALARDIRPQGTPVANGLDVKLKGDPALRAQRALDAVASVHGDGKLPQIPLEEVPPGNPAEAQFRSLRYTGDAIDIQLHTSPGPPDPYRQGSQPELSLVHEIGHFLDNSGLPGPFFESTKPTFRKMQLLMRAIRRTRTYKTIAATARAGGAGVTQWKYLRHRNEIFARAYAQYIAWRSGDQVMIEQLDAILADSDPTICLEHWPHEEFLPIVEAFDVLFEELGWLSRT